MDKSYDHIKYEKDIYKQWEGSGAFRPKFDKNDSSRPFCIIMPPPNANDDLHIGHARFVTIEDILIRYHRMKGEPTLWLPGADHAGIETQFVFEKKLKEQGKSRFDYKDRKKLYQDIWDFVQKNMKNMENQLRSLGASCDWSRMKFTLDPDIIDIVYKTFKKLNDDGYLYRGDKLVNYCTRCGTAYSELEIDHTEKEVEFYTLDYEIIRIATTRPETIFADSAIAVNPNDKKYQQLIGQMATIPLTGGRKIKIIADERVELGFGTDALKVTPAHDFTDWEIGERHKLEKIQVIGEDGKMKSPAPEKYTGMYASIARKAVVEDLKTEGKLIDIKNRKAVLSVCYRCKNQIEPLPRQQWFIKVSNLATKAKEAVKKGETKFAVDRFEKIYNHWLDNLKDWNISRQIVWGMQIPAWKCEGCDEWVVTDGNVPTECLNKCVGKKLIRDEDTFDTWFSSGQWPYATLENTEEGDMERFYPTSVMETAYDILPFWVMRMMMMGIYATGKVPFENILIHGLVRDKNGAKISKSKGNVIDPLEMTEKYGTDSLRSALVWGTLIENDIALSEENVKGQKNFANKIWNLGRFLKFQLDTINKPIPYFEEKDKLIHPEDQKIWDEYKTLLSNVNSNLNNFRLSEAIGLIYDFVWHELADKYVEGVKNRIGDLQTLSVLKTVYLNCVKIIHPFMPFVTEAVWQELKELRHDSNELLIESRWPEI